LFGYVLPEKPELKVKDYELFRAYYCGVCKAIGKRHGQLQRLTLNYDTTFLALILSSVAGERVILKRERCIAHAINKRNIIKNSEIINYASDINVLLAYYKLQDNWRDEKSVLSGTAALALKKSFKKIYKRYGKKCDIIKKRLDEMQELEKEKCNSMDRVAEPFARLMEEVICFDRVVNNENDKKVLKWIGYNLGKWVYILDAFDDIGKDIKNGSYNSLLYQFDYYKQKEVIDESVDEFKSRIKERVAFTLTHSLSQLSGGYDLLSSNESEKTICLSSCKSKSIVPDVYAIVENIIYLGMLKKTEQITGLRSSEEFEKSI
jgi:hypothetical protein